MPDAHLAFAALLASLLLAAVAAGQAAGTQTSVCITGSKSKPQSVQIVVAHTIKIGASDPHVTLQGIPSVKAGVDTVGERLCV